MSDPILALLEREGIPLADAAQALDGMRSSSSLDELAARHSLSKQTIRRQIGRGEGPRLTFFGRAPRVTLADEIEWISRLQNPTGELAEAEARRAERRREIAAIATSAPRRATGKRPAIGQARRNT